MSDPAQIVIIDYTSWRGVRAERRIRPTGEVAFENNEWHPETQWLLYAQDLDNHGEIRTFALKNIHSWRPACDQESTDRESAGEGTT